MLTIHSSPPTLQQRLVNFCKSNEHRPGRVLGPTKGPTIVQAQAQGRECLCDCFTQHAGAFTGPLIVPLQTFQSLYSPVENTSAAPALRRPTTHKRASRRPGSRRSSQHASKKNSAAASAAPTPKHPRIAQRASRRAIRQPSQHAYSAAASAAPTSKRPRRRLTIGESSQHSFNPDSAGDALNSSHHVDMRMIT